jgi:hypothetical protein
MFELIFGIILFILLLVFGVGFFASLIIVLVIDFVLYKPIMLFIIKKKMDDET